MADLKYKTKFFGKVVAAEEIDKKESFVSKANLSSLKSIVPSNIDFENNEDLMGVAFNGAVANQFNLNDDGIDLATALKYKDLFLHKPTNIEHNQDVIVGHIVGCSLSDYDTNEIITSEDLEARQLVTPNLPVNIALSSVVYKSINPSFANLLSKANNEDDDLYQAVSTSWEVMFGNFSIAVTNGGRDFSDIVEIISKEEEVAANMEYLRAFDGPGILPDGRRIFRLITGEILPVGIGFTTNPAASVKGVIVAENSDETPEPALDVEASESEKIKKNISQSNQTDVNHNKSITMNPEEIVAQIQELVNQSKEEDSQFSEKSVANVAKQIADSIKVKNEEFLAEKEQLEKDQEALAKKEKEQEEILSSLQQELAAAKSELEELTSKQLAAEAKALFNSRMDAIDQEYELSDEDRAIIASEVKNLDSSEEGFASYQEKVKVLFAHKSKEFIKAQAEELEKQIDAEVKKRLTSEASISDTTETVEEQANETETAVASEALENAEEVDASVPNTNAESASEESVIEKLKNSFNKETVTVKL